MRLYFHIAFFLDFKFKVLKIELRCANRAVFDFF